MARRSYRSSTPRRRAAPRRSYARPRASASRRPAARRSGRGSAQTVRLVIQQGPAPSAPVMLNPMGGQQLVMPGAPRPRRAKF